MSIFSKHIDKRIAAYQRELIETHYQEVETMYKQIRGWRHDYRNHIQLMKVLAANGDMEAIKDYLDKLDTDLSTVDTVVKTGNAMADAILLIPGLRILWTAPVAEEPCASTFTAMPFDFASEILLFSIASAIALPVFTTVSTVERSVSSLSR